MNRKCAYCDNHGSLTKEHIWPSAIINKYDEELASYNKKIDKLFYSDLVIKDVCAKCNNDILSKLDTYLSKIYDDHLYENLSPGDSTKISYDYDLLLRALLKISFNSARGMSNIKTIKTHERYIKYIKTGGYVSDIQLRLQVVTAARVMKDGVLQDNLLQPRQLRCADIAYDGILSHRFIVRLIAINSFWFYLIISHKKESHDKWKKFIDGFSSWKIQPGIHIKPNTMHLDIPVNQTTYMHIDLMGSLLKAIKNSQ